MLNLPVLNLPVLNLPVLLPVLLRMLSSSYLCPRGVQPLDTADASTGASRTGWLRQRRPRGWHGIGMSSVIASGRGGTRYLLRGACEFLRGACLPGFLRAGVPAPQPVGPPLAGYPTRAKLPCPTFTGGRVGSDTLQASQDHGTAG